MSHGCRGVVDGGGIMDVGVWWMEACKMDIGV